MNALATLTLFAQQNKADADAAAAGGIMASIMACAGTCAIIGGVLFLVIFVIQWKIFTKAGQPGWAALVPIYNAWILVTEICKKEPLWFFLCFVPIGNIVAAWVLCMELAKKFGKSETFGIGLFFLQPIFLAILAFGDAEYQGGRSSKKKSKGDDDDENW